MKRCSSCSQQRLFRKEHLSFTLENAGNEAFSARICDSVPGLAVLQKKCIILLYGLYHRRLQNATRRNLIMGFTLLLGGFVVVVIIPVVISVVSAVVSGVAAAVDDEEE